MKKLFLLLVAFSITPINCTIKPGLTDFGAGCIAIVVIGTASYLGYQYFTTPTNNTPQQQDNISNEININKNETIDNPITPPNNPKELDILPINHSIEQNNNTIENLLNQKQQNKEPEINQNIQDFLNNTQPKKESEKKPDLQEIIKPKIKPNNIKPSKYPSEIDLEILYGN